MTLLNLVKPYTKTPPARIEAMADAVRSIERNRIAGDIAECGVWRGGNIILARMIAPKRICWLFDTFSGMTRGDPDVDKTRGGLVMKDKVGKDAVSVDSVKANMVEAGVFDPAYLRFVVGPVEDTLRDPQNLPDRLALLRLDTDWYASTKVEMEMLWPRLQPGGVLIIDDYGHWMGCRMAVNNYFGDEPPGLVYVDYSCRMLVKQ